MGLALARLPQPEQETALAWERMPTESEPAWAAFQAYLKQPSPRVVLAAYRSIYGRPGAKSPPGWFRIWGKQFHWQERAAAYDNYQVRMIEEAKKEALARRAEVFAERQITWREREWEIAEALVERALEVVNLSLYEKVQEYEEVSPDGETIKHVTILKPVHARLRDAATLADTASKLARLASDMATNREILETPGVKGYAIVSPDDWDE